MTSTPSRRSLLHVHRVLSLHHFLQSFVSQNLDVASKVTTLAMDSIFFLADRLLHLQAVFRVAGKYITVDVGYHYTNLSLLEMICTNGLMNPTEIITNRVTPIFLASLPMISVLWGVFSATLFLIPHFVMLIVNKLIDCCLFLYTIASISLRCLCFYF